MAHYRVLAFRVLDDARKEYLRGDIIKTLSDHDATIMLASGSIEPMDDSAPPPAPASPVPSFQQNDAPLRMKHDGATPDAEPGPPTESQPAPEAIKAQAEPASLVTTPPPAASRKASP